MTSKISLFSIMKEDIRHRLWMVAMSFLGSFLALPIFLLMSLSNIVYYDDVDRALLTSQSVLNFFSNHMILSCGFVAFMGALIVGLLGFSFLYSKNKVDLFHSIPVKRSKIFLCFYLDGIFIWLFPFLINLLFAITIGAFKLNNITLLKVLLANVAISSILIVFSFLIIYHLCLVCVMISGNFFNALMSTIVLGFSAIGIYALVSTFCSLYFEHFMQLPFAWDWDRIVWASPLASVFPLLSKVDTPFMKIACFILMVVNLVLAWRLYLNRPSELAEQGIQNKRIQGFLRILGTYALALCGAFLNYFVNFRSYYGGQNNNITWSLFGIILMSIIFWGIFNIIFNMNFKTFFKNKIQLGITTFLALLTFLSISGDWYGFDLRIPDKDNIKGGTFSVSSYSDGVYGQNLYYDTLDFSEILYTDVDSIYSLLTKLIDNNTPAGSYDNIEVSLTLKNGGSFYRKYKVFSEDLELLRPIIEDETYKIANYSIASGLLPQPDTISFGDSTHKTDHRINDEETIQKLEKAYKEDFDEHYNMNELNNAPVVGTLYRMYEEYGISPNEPVYANYTRTIALLQELQPDMVFTIEALAIDSINFEVYIDDPLPKEAIYSYFGLEGYPTYEELTAEINMPSEYPKEMAATEVSARYKKIVTDEESIQELLPYLCLGDYYRSNIYSSNYISIGYIDSNNDRYYCFVEKGKLPKKWIDLLVEQ